MLRDALGRIYLHRDPIWLMPTGAVVTWADKDMQIKQHEAMLYAQAGEKNVKCNLCARGCTISEDKVGFCRVRKNVGGKLYALNYAKAIAANPDPIEKKPLYHFLPRSTTYSVATIGCNLACSYCQNWSISQEREIVGTTLPPERVVQEALANGCAAISYTYTEPTIFFEYAYDTARLAHKEGLFNTFVTNGYLSPEAIMTIAPYLNAATVDFKGGGDPTFYRNYCSVPDVKPIFDALREFKQQKIHVEITNLVIPKIGDSLERIKDFSVWIHDNLGADVPVHFIRFHPDFDLLDLPATPTKTLEQAREIALKEGLNYVYVGNVPGHAGENTYCSNCHELLIERFGFQITRWNLTPENACPRCGYKAAIIGRREIGGGWYSTII